jgi:hypothetical protein
MSFQVKTFENLVFIQTGQVYLSFLLSSFTFHSQDGTPCHHFQLFSSEIALSVNQFEFSIARFPFC